MKRNVLMVKVARAAKVAEKDWSLMRAGNQHDLWRCGATQVAIPRHKEINEYTAEGICKALEAELGKDWWRR